MHALIEQLTQGVLTGTGERVTSYNPSNGEVLGEVSLHTAAEYEQCINLATQTAQSWATVPAPQRGELVRRLGLALRAE